LKEEGFSENCPERCCRNPIVFREHPEDTACGVEKDIQENKEWKKGAENGGSHL
jgi:hypothetical protein